MRRERLRQTVNRLVSGIWMRPVSAIAADETVTSREDAERRNRQDRPQVKKALP